MIAYFTIVQSVKRDGLGLLDSEDIAGGAFIAVSEMSNSVLQFRSASGVEVVDLSWTVRSQERDGVTRVTASFGGTCTSLESMIKLQSCRISRQVASAS